LKTARQIADSQQGLAADSGNQADRLRAVFLFGRPLPCAAAVRRSDDGRIRKSSSFFPDLSCAVSQRGCFPRPAQVSDGRAEKPAGKGVERGSSP
jgi:hypothetical protein